MSLPNRTRRRVRPRFYGFALIAGALSAVLLWHGHRIHAHATPPRQGQTAYIPAPRLQVRSVWFSLPQSLSSYAFASSGSAMQIAGGKGTRGPSVFTAVISPQGVVQGPSLALPAGAALVPRAGSTVAAGGLAHDIPTASAISLDSGSTVPGFLPHSLAYAAAAWCPGTFTAYLSGGESRPGRLQSTIWEDANGSFTLWGHLPQGVRNASSAAGPDTILVEGGTLWANRPNPYVWIFQKSSHTLVQTLTLPDGLSGAAVVYADGSYWIMGGTVRGRIVGTIWQIRGSHLVKARSALPTPLCDFGAALMDHALWIVGGLTPTGPVRAIREISFPIKAAHVKK